MLEDGTFTACGACGDIVDPDASNVVRLIKWDDLGPSDDGANRWVEGKGVHFHKAHAPKLSMTWREPPNA